MAGHQRTADTPAGGGRADGRTPRRAADRGALYYGWEYMLTLWGKGGYGGSPNAEAGKCTGRCINTPALVHIGAKRREGEGVVVRPHDTSVALIQGGTGRCEGPEEAN